MANALGFFDPLLRKEEWLSRDFHLFGWYGADLLRDVNIYGCFEVEAGSAADAQSDLFIDYNVITETSGSTGDAQVNNFIDYNVLTETSGATGDSSVPTHVMPTALITEAGSGAEVEDATDVAPQQYVTEISVGLTQTILGSFTLSQYWAVASDGAGHCAAVYVGTSSNLAQYSSDGGLTWTATTMSSTGVWVGVVWSPGNSKFVAVGGTSGSAYSSTGATWTYSAPATGSPASVGFYSSGGSWCWACGYGSGAEKVQYSSNGGVTWTSVGATGITANDGYSIAAKPSTRYCVLVDQNVSQTTYVDSGSGFVAYTSAMPAAKIWTLLEYSPGLNLFLAVDSTTSYGATSPDGITWTAVTVPTPAFANWYYISCDGYNFYLFDNTHAYVSGDCVNWASTTLSHPPVATHYPPQKIGTGTLYAGSLIYNYGNLSATQLTVGSSVTDTPNYLPGSYLYITEANFPLTVTVPGTTNFPLAYSAGLEAVWYSNGIYLMYYNTGTPSTDYYTSTDAVTWALRAFPAAWAYTILLVRGVFQAQAWGGAFGSVLEGTWQSTDGITWTTATPFASTGTHSNPSNYYPVTTFAANHWWATDALINTHTTYNIDLSNDGVTWWGCTMNAIPGSPTMVPYFMYSAAYNGSTMLVSTDKGIWYSTDLINYYWANCPWGTFTQNASLLWTGTRFVAFEGGTTGYTYTSVTGYDNWRTVALPAGVNGWVGGWLFGGVIVIPGYYSTDNGQTWVAGPAAGQVVTPDFMLSCGYGLTTYKYIYTAATETENWFGSAYSVSETEAGSGSETENATNVPGSQTITESGAANDSESNTYIAYPVITEPGTATDNYSAWGNFIVAILEAGSGSDSQTAVTPQVANITEAGSAMDTEINVLITAAAILESGATGDAQVAVWLAYAALGEAVSGADLTDATMYLLAGELEIVTAGDSPEGDAGFLNAIAEAGAAADTYDGFAQILADRMEAASLADTSSMIWQLGGQLVEAGIAQDDVRGFFIYGDELQFIYVIARPVAPVSRVQPAVGLHALSNMQT